MREAGPGGKTPAYDEDADRAESARPRARRKGLDRLSNASLPVLGAAAARLGFQDPRLLAHWHDIAGPSLAALARPRSLKNQTLSLSVDGAAAILVRHQTQLIMERVNAFLGHEAVKQIKLAPGLSHKTGAAPVPALAPLTESDRRHIGASLAKARQPELKARLEALFAARLARAKPR